MYRIVCSFNGNKKDLQKVNLKSYITFKPGVNVAMFVEVSLKNCFHTFFCVVVVAVVVVVQAFQKTF